MIVVGKETGKIHQVEIEPVKSEDFKTITKKRYFFSKPSVKSLYEISKRKSMKNLIQ